MDKKERMEALIQAYEESVKSYELLMCDFQKRVSEMQDSIRDLGGKRIDARNEIKALRLLLTDPEGNWTPGLKSHEEKSVMIFRRDAIDKVRLYVAVGDFSKARYWLKRVHLDWLPELLVDPSQMVSKMASRRIKREVPSLGSR